MTYNNEDIISFQLKFFSYLIFFKIQFLKSFTKGHLMHSYGHVIKAKFFESRESKILYNGTRKDMESFIDAIVV